MAWEALGLGGAYQVSSTSPGAADLLKHLAIQCQEGTHSPHLHAGVQISLDSASTGWVRRFSACTWEADKAACGH